MCWRCGCKELAGAWIGNDADLVVLVHGFVAWCMNLVVHGVVCGSVREAWILAVHGVGGAYT